MVKVAQVIPDAETRAMRLPASAGFDSGAFFPDSHSNMAHHDARIPATRARDCLPNSSGEPRYCSDVVLISVAVRIIVNPTDAQNRLKVGPAEATIRWTRSLNSFFMEVSP